MKKFKSLLMIITLIGSLTLGTMLGYASEFNFAVTPLVPENQVDKAKSYFDILMKPGESQTLEVQMRNDTEQDVTIENTINSTTTNLNGVVEYGENKIETDSSLRFNLKDLAEVPTEITIPKHSEVTLPIKVTMPDETFDGVLAGGITFKEKVGKNSEKDTNEQGLAIKNEYSYVVAILLHQNDTVVTPDLTLLDVGPGQVNARNVINVSLQNPEAAYLNQLRLINEVTKKGQAEVLYSSDASGMQMAPNSNFAYPISLAGEKLAAGEYHLKSVAYGGKSDDGEYTIKNEDGEEESYRYKWEFEKDFTITGQVARELNAKDVLIKTDYTWLYILIGILLLLLALLIIFLYRRKKKQNEEA